MRTPTWGDVNCLGIRSVRAGWAVAFVLLLIAVPMAAQQSTGSITGTVQDSSGAAVPGATVTVRNVETGQERALVTNDGGGYSALSLPVGQYEIRVEKSGFSPVERTGITLVVGQQAVVPIEIAVGGVQQTVTVTGEPPLMNTTPASTSGLVNEQQIKDLPLNGRSWDTLITLNPGTTNFTSNQSTTSTGKGLGFNFSVSGNREDFNIFLMNGIEYTGVSTADVMPGGVSGLLLGVDAIREFNVQQNTYSAEYGKKSGAQVSVVTMSGSNQLHGDIFEFIRNNIFDAMNFFTQGINGAPPVNPPFKRNQFGGALGGPIKKDKTFIFGSYEGFRERLNLSDVTFVPDTSVRNGTFTGGAATPIIDAQGIPAYFALWPVQNGPEVLTSSGASSGTAVAFSNPLESIREDFGNVRIDQNFSSKDTLSGTYTIDDGYSLTPGSNPLTQTISVLRAQVASLSETHVFSPSLLNVARFGFSRAKWNLIASPPVTPPGTSFVPGQPAGQISIGSAGFNAPGAVSVAGSNGSQQFETIARNLFTYTDDVQWTKGKHLISAGVWFQRVQSNDDAANQRYGLATFSSLTAFLHGQATQIAAVLNPAEIGWRQLAGAWYVQDVINVRSNLTLSLGIRHEANNGWNSPAGMASNYVMGTTGCSAGTVQCLQTVPTLGTSPYTQNNARFLFSPRIGVAWSPFTKTVIHAGFGTYYDQMDYIGSCCDGSPIGNNLNINPSLGSKSAPAPFPTLMTATLPGAKASPAGVQPDLKMPTVEEWTLKIEQGITPNMLFSVAYVGEHGFHLPDTVDMNTVTPTATANGSIGAPFPAVLVRANNSIANTRYTLSNANSSYNALQVSMTRRLSQSLQFRGSYTWSKSLDDHSSSFLANEGIAGSTTVMIPQNVRNNWGPSTFNPTQQVAGNFSYDLPFGHGRLLGNNASGLVDKFIGGWSWHGIVTLQTGFPFTPLVGTNQSNNGDSRNPDRVSLNPNFTGPIVTGNINSSGQPGYFNTNAFILPPAGTYGNAGRGILTGPGLAEFDTSLFKTLPITERVKTEFRAEFFNVVNHPNFGMPVVSTFASGAVSSNAGDITYMSTTQREIQFGLKVLW
jgi:hypothetical protein